MKGESRDWAVVMTYPSFGICTLVGPRRCIDQELVHHPVGQWYNRNACRE